MTWQDEIRKEKDPFDMSGEELVAEYRKNDKKVENIFGEIAKDLYALMKAIEADEDKKSLMDKAIIVDRFLPVYLPRMRDIINANYRLGMVRTHRQDQEIERLQQEIERLKGE